MTPKEKAEELLNKFIPHTKVFHELLGWEDYIDSAKQCALIAVDEIIESEPILPNNSKPFGEKIQSIRHNFIDANNFWQEVKNELNKQD